MTQSVDLDADMGEGFGPLRVGDDAALPDIVTSESARIPVFPIFRALVAGV